MRAVIAFLGSVRVRVDIERVVRASLHAGFAADASVAVEIDYAVFAAKQRRHRADGYAGRVVAVITPHHGKESACIWVFALFDVLYPRAKRAERDFVFRFTGDRACVAAYAFSMVNDKAISHVFNIQPIVARLFSLSSLLLNRWADAANKPFNEWEAL
jgi:hypothetical protein